jgi:hypothetical protein
MKNIRLLFYRLRLGIDHVNTVHMRSRFDQVDHRIFMTVIRHGILITLYGYPYERYNR